MNRTEIGDLVENKNKEAAHHHHRKNADGVA